MCTLLPNNVLSTLTCTICRKYLSIQPVTIDPDGSKRCGRCQEENHTGPRSLINSLTARVLFKCVNQYEGCNVALKPVDMLNHEKSCTGGDYECNVCSLMLESAYLYLKHFEVMHKDLMLSSSVVVIDLTKNCKNFYMYVKDNLIFVFFISVDGDNGILKLGLIHIGPKTIAQSIKYRMFAHDKDHVFISTNLLPCDTTFKPSIVRVINFDKHHTVANCDFIVKTDYVSSSHFINVKQIVLPPEPPKKTLAVRRASQLYNSESLLKNVTMRRNSTDNCRDMLVPKPTPATSPSVHKILLTKFSAMKHLDWKLSECQTKVITGPIYTIPSTCPLCSELFDEVIYCCDEETNKHIICESCYLYEKECPSGHCYNEDSNAMRIKQNVGVYCKWGCGNYRFSTMLQLHENSFCHFRPTIKCPVVNCKEILPNANSLRDHFAAAHPFQLLHVIDQSNIYFKYTDFTEKQFYVFSRDIFLVMYVEFELEYLRIYVADVIHPNGRKKAFKAVINCEECINYNPIILHEGGDIRFII